MWFKKIVDMAHERGLERYEPEDKPGLDHDTRQGIMWRAIVEAEPEIKARIHMLKKEFFHAQMTLLENVR